MTRLLPFSVFLAFAVGCGESAPEVASTAAVEPAAEVTESLEVVAADYGDSMLAEGVALSEPVAEALAPLESVDAATPTLTAFTLRRGESLAHFARWSELPVEEVARYSDLSLQGDYPVGTEVKLPLEGDALTMFESLRAEHATRRVERYLSTRGGTVGEEVYTVRTGDSAWGIAKAEGGLPVWLVEAYNPDVDLERLRPGDELTLPVLADVVVDAEVPMD